MGRGLPGPHSFRMKQTPRTLLLLTIANLALSAWLILYGLQLRFFGFYLDRGILSVITPPTNWMVWINWITPDSMGFDLGWPLIVIGCSLLGSLLGVWLRQNWSRGSLIVFSIASLITLHWMNLLSIVTLAISFSSPLRSWLIAENSADG